MIYQYHIALFKKLKKSLLIKQAYCSKTFIKMYNFFKSVYRCQNNFPVGHPNPPIKRGDEAI